MLPHKLYEKTKDIHLIIEYLGDRNDTQFVRLLLAHKFDSFTSMMRNLLQPPMIIPANR